MKKLFTILLILYSAIGMAQGPGVPKPEGYTWISHRYDWLSGKFRGLHVPAGTTPALVSGQFTGAGALFVDSVNHRFYFYSGGQWRFGGGIDSVTYSTDSTKIWQGGVSFGIPKGGFFSPNQTSAANTTHNAAGFNLTINNVGTLVLASSSLNITGSTLVDIQTPSFQAYSDEVESDDVGMVQTFAGLAQIEAFDDDPEGDLFIGTYLRGRYNLGENTYGSVAIMGMAASTGPPISYVMVDSTDIKFKGALYNFNNVATTTDTTYKPFVINASGDVRRFTFWPGGSGGGGSDSSANLVVNNAGTGLSIFHVTDTTELNLSRFAAGYGLIAEKLSDSTIQYRADSSLLATKLGLNHVKDSLVALINLAGGGPANWQHVGDPSEMLYNHAIDTIRRRAVFIYDGWAYYLPIMDSVDLTPSTDYDDDAQAYMDAVELAGRTLTDLEKGYIDTYVLALKAGGVWAKIVDRGIPIWGTSAPSLVTLKGVHTVTASGSPTFSSSGVDFNGSNQYLITDIIPSTHLSLTGAGVSYYSQDNVIGTFTDIGCATSSNRFEFALYVSGTGLYLRSWSSTHQATSLHGGSTAGYFHGSRTSSSDLRVYLNGTQTGSTYTSTGGSRPTHAIYIGARNADGTAGTFSTRKCSLWSVDTGLTPAEVAADATATEAFMDSMGIGVIP